MEELHKRLYEDELSAKREQLQEVIAGEPPGESRGDLNQFSAWISRGVLSHITEDVEKVRSFVEGVLPALKCVP